MRDLSLHILDLTENSIRAEASEVRWLIEESVDRDTYTITLSDNGKGMDLEMCKRVVDPFYTTRTTRDIGLGLPLIKQSAESAGGGLRVISELGEGTELVITFINSNIDRTPLGDIAITYLMEVIAYPSVRFIYRHTTDLGEYYIDSDELREVLEGTPIESSEIKESVLSMINDNLRDIGYSR